MSRIWSILVLVAAMFATTAIQTSEVSGSEAPSESDLKAKFRERHAVLLQLKDAGKVGETTDGLVEPVRAAYGADDVPGGGGKVSGFVSAENVDRKQLYRLIGERTGEPASAVAKQAAIRAFRKASPKHYLKLSNGRWVQKKDLPPAK